MLSKDHDPDDSASEGIAELSEGMMRMMGLDT